MSKIYTREQLENEAEIDLLVQFDENSSPEDDLSTEDAAPIRARINGGDEWAWAYVVVSAKVEIDGEEYEGSDSLGACNYENEADFRASDYFTDMRSAALDALYDELPDASDPWLNPELNGESILRDGDYIEPGDAIDLRLSNADAEEGINQCINAPLGWLNSARMEADPKDDAINFSVSIDDPRGALGFTVRRLPDGRIVIHVPEAGIGRAQHVDLAVLHEGTFVVVDRKGEPRNFGGGE